VARRVAVRHGGRSLHVRELQRALPAPRAALRRRGVARGDTVAIMAPNVPAHARSALRVPALGAVLNALNYRLDARTIAFCLEHGRRRCC
jgi:fatty-acyl-CoA synthase